ncbi:hypothetical protein KG892_00615 [Vermiphilus pyriformis]|nr:MAG: hypothetical protein KG892_00615 [Vermiphilus pyriformis]
MKHMRLIIYFIYGYGISCISTTAANQAVICVPIADLVGQPLLSLSSAHQNIEKMYAQQPIVSPAAGKPTTISYRIHQALLGDQVNVLQENTHEVCLSIPSLFYLTSTGQKAHTYWTLKKNIKKISDFPKGQQNRIATAINWSNPDTIKQPDTIILKKPYYIPAIKTTCSLGTRFKVSSYIPKTKIYKVWALKPHSARFLLVDIPENACICPSNIAVKDQRTTFVDLLRSWTQLGANVPYVWGGSSFIDANDKTSKLPYIRSAGFDCSNMIARATQMVGIPYFYKNSKTALSFLKPVTGKVSVGDIIALPGHVMVISDLIHHKAIEARDYDAGYGKIHEVDLRHVFKDISTYDELISTLESKTLLTRLKKDGSVQNEKIKVSLLRLPAI